MLVTITPPDATLYFNIKRQSIKGNAGIPLRHNFSLRSTKTKQKPKMGAEKVTMNIVVVGQVQSAKAIKSVAKANNQLMVVSWV
ncbi:Uncharacterized protein FWK35_00005487 [Aphis craccivora]|uniref:Uncharacterized protein n=1 Tax=Aphis craccivora TaxID=307492 RepID=A0A6G0ZL18_APHCR|nr:Uncharacterized protein FWK35_00005487 [Aphis craccivora]